MAQALNDFEFADAPTLPDFWKGGAFDFSGASYTLDSAGNRTAKTDYLAGGTSNYTGVYPEVTAQGRGNEVGNPSHRFGTSRTASLGVSSYTTNASNELTATSNATYTYDSNGNTLTKTVGSNTTTYAWDFENRLTSVTLPGTGGTVTFKYDPFGRRIEKVSPTFTSIFAYDGDNLIETANSSGSAVARYTQTQNIDEPLAEDRSGTTSYYEADGLGSVSSLTSAAGALADTYTYDSFGNLTNSAGSVSNPFSYTAREFDTETGLDYYRARYYDSTTGRFLSEDPVRYNGGINFYRYVRNNPTDLMDPFGECPKEAPITCDTPLPNHQTVGDVVRRQRAILQSVYDTWLQTGEGDLFANMTAAFYDMSVPGGPMDFKNNEGMKVPGNEGFLGRAGNFVYYATGWGYLPTPEIDAGAMLYAIKAHHALYSPNAQVVRDDALAANGCQK